VKLLATLVFFGLTAMADTYEYKIEGMSCSGCKNMIKSAVCGLPGIKTCDVEIGSMKLVAEEGKTLDQAALTTALDELNKKNKEDYKIAKATKVDEAKTSTNATKKADHK
jgi:copper chaperone CopZ